MGSDARTAILDAAIEVFARYGFKKASVEDIARRADVGKGSIYLHFENKEALFEACAQKVFAEVNAALNAAIRQATTPQEQIRAYIRFCLKPHAWTPGGRRVELTTVLELGEQAAHLIPVMVEQEVALLAGIIESGVAQGLFSVAEPRLLAEGLVELMSSVGDSLLTKDLDGHRERALEACFTVFIRGLSASKVPQTPSR